MRGVRASQMLGVVLATAALGGAGCLDLDAFAHNPTHCSQVGPETCEEVPDGFDPSFDRVCLACDAPYDWQRDYPWPEGMLADGDTIRPVADAPIREQLPTEDGLGTLDTYFIASHGEVAARRATTILYNHGNYAGIEHYAPRARVLHELGYNVLIWDYRGYGKSEPAQPPSPEQFIADARQVRDWAATKAPDPARIVIYGYSLGAVPAVEMATWSEPCALILEAPFTSMEQVTERNTGRSLNQGFLSQGYCENNEKLEGFEPPLMALIGSEDDAFDGEHVGELVAAAAGPTDYWVIEGAAHGIGRGTVEVAGLSAYDARLGEFLSATSTCFE